ncbi:MAG: NADH-quinone oxidoreductase subunit A [Candidatus Dadabacteria bacterium]|nr:MAG: NADH-quinone oxidoreductase subunit A [Candidatus Dadabacteria bacterium]
MDGYTGLVLFMLAVAGFVLTMLFLSIYVGPRIKTHTKQLPFECGSVSVGDVREQRFSVRFYLVAMLFILFDIEVIFMYPWAVTLTEVGWGGFYAMLSFMLVVLVGLVYVWRKGVLNWND